MNTEVDNTAHENEARLRLAIEAGRMAVWDFDIRTDRLTGTDDLNRLLGFPPGQILDIDEVRSRYYPGDGDRIRDESQASLKRGGRFIQSEYRYFWPDGSLRWHLMRAEVLFASDGGPTKVIGIVIDITDRKHAEEALEERERELRAALEAAALGTYTFDHKTKELKSSRRLNEIYAYPLDKSLTLEDLQARFHPKDLNHIMELFASALDPSEFQISMEFRLLLPDGTVRWVQGRGEYVREEGGQPLRSRGIVADITDRKQWEDHQKLLVNELNHRVKNTLSTVQAIASHTFRNPESISQAKTEFTDRLVALSKAHDILTETNWSGANLAEIVRRTIDPHHEQRRGRFDLRGPTVYLAPKAALSISMALHELCTNAAKYGALTTDLGRVEVVWRITDTDAAPRLNIRWSEFGGPPVTAPTRKGFGSRLIESALAAELNGEARIDYPPSGVICIIDAPLPVS